MSHAENLRTEVVGDDTVAGVVGILEGSIWSRAPSPTALGYGLEIRGSSS